MNICIFPCNKRIFHFLDDPGHAVGEAARLLGPEGHVLITDFAAHDIESYRENYAHRRLGFSDLDMSNFLNKSGFELTQTRSLPATDPQTPDVKIWHAVKRNKPLSATG